MFLSSRRWIACRDLDQLRRISHRYCRRATKVSTSAYSSSSRQSTDSETIFSGIQPTGVPHLGNYLGALSQWVRLQNEASPSTSLLFSIVDLHSLTSHQPASIRRRSRREVLAALLAAGLDPDRCTIFYQSHVPAHTELHWILSCEASTSWLNRMTQWKSKLSLTEGSTISHQTHKAEDSESLKLGLFSYPVLQAADILVHRATKVPVGEDQQQHIEFARNCAGHFNRTYGSVNPILVEPTVLMAPCRRMMSLTDPQMKMSKSHPSSWSRILLNDDPDKISKKIKKAVTDSYSGITYEPQRRPGLSNLIAIICHFEQISAKDVVDEFQNTSNIRLLKERVADVLIAHLSPIREKYNALLGEHHARSLDDIAHHGAAKARSSANKTMELVRTAIGV